ncbi:MAG: hypothetical protein COU31_04950 [Candidatus Magasanikbacteria bacterium CG10_big_fil_rev_8_21_14_0_10_40_10]|uniref:Uncharacterized protein n=1 Tax=Candidatus Magasanikbacteria bacterium CG10_big_fil_rev_8_21_14_0_10_40_10 TaxID=1974648 RepID=A0A2M6W2S8_9BACT|nr:MAG: hypothetical protein COU31_04950 [Candidatus Magasanikbacteria bacterium CG10_big_fil_rev_8_21_14_0_10_40_10]
MNTNGDRQKLSREQKTGFVLLLVFAVLALSLGILQIRNNMYKPFALSNAIPPISKDLINDANVLRYRDTDLDKLNDFEEIYVYQTSPYLADTDSDGVNDYDEINKGTNPLCASGQQCVGSLSTSADAGLSDTTTLSGIVGVAPVAPANLDLASALQNPQQVRKMLIDAGMDKATLDKVTDSQLSLIVSQVFQSTTTLNNLTGLGSFSASSTY